MKNTNYSPETHLILRWQQFCEDDKTAFSEIAELNYSALYHYGTRFTVDRDLIKDCLQDLFLEIWEKRHSLSGVAAIKPYLFQSLRNNLLRRVRKQSCFSDIHDDDVQDDLSPEISWIIQETDQLTSDRLKQAIDSLPKRQKEALYLRYYEDLSYEEIANVMGLQRQAVANYLQYGIHKLREYWSHSAILLVLCADFNWH
ncbi:RNA polymerase sigma factor (sigma-70 family) [Larkinella arboricola]|uniref:RNA polymerase sigma factor (Sigma-70 family) n=1 Tax=Larkinella arboricola TaxID=643671 RepID=A0A327WJ29_LARAB|nr:RNA polymerase sigma factor [Larkinella arboricola]RAJ91074.1 RNA polymerase sigma factor (sigma-70 family) [Larkinella arboricola]